MQSWSMSSAITSIDPIDSRSGLDADDRAVTVLGYPDRVFANRHGTRLLAEGNGVAERLAGFDVEPGDGAVARVGDPDRARPGIDPPRPLADRDRLAEQGPGRGVETGH